MKYDIIVVGAGITGLTSAYYLKRKYPEKNILLVEKNAAAGQETTEKGCGGFRNIYTSQQNFLLADTTVNFYKHAQYDLKHDLGIEMYGYFWTLNEGNYKRMERIVGDLKRKRPEIKLEFLDRDGVKRISPDLVLDFDGDEEAKALGIENIYGGIIFPEAGTLDKEKLVNFYEESYKKLAGKVLYNTRVVKLITEPKTKLGIPGEEAWQEIKIVGIRTTTEDYYGDTIVVTVGPWASKLLDSLGIDCLFKPLTVGPFFILSPPNYDQIVARMNFSFLFAPPTPPRILLLTRRAKRTFEVCLEPEGWPMGHEFGLEDSPTVRGRMRDYYSTAYRFLRKYFPAFEGVKPIGVRPPSQYQFNSFDGNPWVLKRAGMIYVGGMSGSGQMKADALGRIAAAKYGDEEYAKLYGGRKFKVSDLSLEKRNVEKESFIL